MLRAIRKGYPPVTATLSNYPKVEAFLLGSCPITQQTSELVGLISTSWWWWCYPTPSEGWGRGGGDPTVGPRPKVWTRGQKWKK